MTTIWLAKYGASLPQEWQRMIDTAGSKIVMQPLNKLLLVEAGKGVCTPQCRHTTPLRSCSRCSFMAFPHTESC